MQLNTNRLNETIFQERRVKANSYSKKGLANTYNHKRILQIRICENNKSKEKIKNNNNNIFSPNTPNSKKITYDFNNQAPSSIKKLTFRYENSYEDNRISDNKNNYVLPYIRNIPKNIYTTNYITKLNWLVNNTANQFTTTNKNNLKGNKFQKEVFPKNNEELCKNQSKYTYVIRPENCGYLIKKCFEHRKNWIESTDLSYKNFNFKWQQNTRNINYNTLSNGNTKQMVNHFEFHGSISNKANLLVNMMHYAEIKDQNVFKYIPLTIIFDYKDDNFFYKSQKFDFLFKNIESFVVPFYEIDLKKNKKYDKLYNLFFPCADNLGHKTVISIPESHYISKNDKPPEIINTNSTNNINNIDTKSTFIQNSLNKKIKNNFWLVKAPDLNRGMCIKIVNNLSNIKKYIREYNVGINRGYDENDIEEEKNEYFYYNSQNCFYNTNFKNNNNNNNNNNNEDTGSSINKYKSSVIIIQKYIEKPLLYYGRKFDIRIWVLLTHELNVYMFNEGHLKCCSVNYDLNTDNSFCHLTNYSFQKYNSNFGKFEYGNEVSFDDLQKNIEVNYNNRINFKYEILPKIKEIIKFTFQSVKNKINSNNRNYTFEIFGFDFMIDCNFQPFLIEVNMNPGLEESSPLIKMLVPRMLDDALRLTVDKEFGTVYNFEGVEKHSLDLSIPYQSPFPVNGYFNSDNLFKFVCDLKEEKEYLNANSLRRYYYNNHKTIQNYYRK